MACEWGLKNGLGRCESPFYWVTEDIYYLAIYDLLF